MMNYFRNTYYVQKEKRNGYMIQKLLRINVYIESICNLLNP